MAPSRLSLLDAVDQTLRRDEGLGRSKAVFNLSAEGVLALDGVLPVILPDDPFLLDSSLFGRLGFDAHAVFQPLEPGSSLGGNPVATNKNFFSLPLSGSYYHFMRESLKIYGATLGIRFDTERRIGDLAFESIPAALAYGSLRMVGANEFNAFSNVRVGVAPFRPGDYTFLEEVDSQGNVFNRLSRIVIEPQFGAIRDLLSDSGESPFARYAFSTYVHETGHSLGLSHPGTYNGRLAGLSELDWVSDSKDESVMSYVSQSSRADFGLSSTGVDLEPVTPRVLDFLALDRIYGSQVTSDGRRLGISNAFVGDTIYGFNTSISPEVSEVYAGMADLLGGNLVAMTIVDAGGVDTIDLSGFAKSNRLDLRVMTGDEFASRFSSLNGTTNNLSLAVGTVIENAIGGSAGDVFWDNGADNVLEGRDGDDRFYLTAGLDEVIGGEGLDTVVIPGLQSDYQIQVQAIGGSGGDGGSAGNVSIRLVSDPAAFTATLTSVEQLLFQGDGSLLSL